MYGNRINKCINKNNISAIATPARALVAYDSKSSLISFIDIDDLNQQKRLESNKESINDDRNEDVIMTGDTKSDNNDDVIGVIMSVSITVIHLIVR
jgi:hypothetical protein